jgi:hypothetical protein
MRFLSTALLFAGLHMTATAGSLLSVNATAGPQSCQMQSASGIASCSTSASVLVPGGQFASPVTAGGTVSFGETPYSNAGPLDYTLSAYWNMGQGIGLSGQASVSIAANLTLPSDSGDWTFYLSLQDSTDDSGGALGPIQIVTTDGSAWLSSGFPSTFTVNHPVGTPLDVSLDLSDFVAESDSSNNLTFDLRMVDPVAAPEPLTLTTLLFGLAGVITLIRKRSRT